MVSNPAWEDVLMGQVDATLASRVAKKPPHRDFRTRVPLSAASSIHEAAAARGMSASAYIRRATLAFAAYDLGLDLAELLRHEPATRLNSESPRAVRAMLGEGHGEWRIGGLS